MIRSEERIPKLRSRGRANRRKLLHEAERLLATSNGDGVRFSDVFESAGVSRGSAYRIYIGMDDLIQDLAGEWISNFVTHLRGLAPEPVPQTWQTLSDFTVARAAEYWTETADTLRMLPRVSTNAPASYKQAMMALSHCIAELFDRYFDMPEIPNWHGKLGFYAQLADLSFRDSVRLHDRITPERMHEAQSLCRAYLASHLPESLPPQRD